MEKNIFQHALTFILLIMAQAVIFNHIVLFGIAIPFIFIYFIIKLPVSTNPSNVIFWSFLLGTVMDIFQDTPGMCGLACTCIGALRMPLLRIFIPREDDIIHSAPSIRTFGLGTFVRYVATVAAIFCTLVFTIEAFTFFHLGLLLQRIVASTLLTSLLLVAIESISRKKRSGEKRL